MGLPSRTLRSHDQSFWPKKARAIRMTCPPVAQQCSVRSRFTNRNPRTLKLRCPETIVQHQIDTSAHQIVLRNCMGPTEAPTSSTAGFRSPSLHHLFLPASFFTKFPPHQHSGPGHTQDASQAHPTTKIFGLGDPKDRGTAANSHRGFIPHRPSKHVQKGMMRNATLPKRPCVARP